MLNAGFELGACGSLAALIVNFLSLIVIPLPLPPITFQVTTTEFRAPFCSPPLRVELYRYFNVGQPLCLQPGKFLHKGRVVWRVIGYRFDLAGHGIRYRFRGIGRGLSLARPSPLWFPLP